MADLAAAAEVSPSHFARSFRASTGRTVHRFVEEARLARAQAMLRETNLPLKQVAAALGFSGPSSFTLAFRRATGTTPARYRAEAPPC
ncbi:helix-turn-helix transcriptional regulator [Rhizorhabdus histidinilytica]